MIVVVETQDHSEDSMADFRTMQATTGARSSVIDAGLRAHMNKVYGTMSVGMLITALAAWAIAGLATTTDPANAVGQMANGTMLTSFGAAIYTSALRWVVLLAPLGMIFAFGAVTNRLSASGAQLFFWTFAALIGVSLSSIFIFYTAFSIVQTFLVTSIAFAGLSLWGYTTKKDISGWGSFLIMGVIGLIVAMIINIFLASPAIMFAISIIGVLIFAGLTAYDTQAIKNQYLEFAHQGDSEWLGKSAIMGALRLYLDFINMFMFLLQLFGNRN
jgi:FtsH-binding integral membrane protein